MKDLRLSKTDIEQLAKGNLNPAFLEDDMLSSQNEFSVIDDETGDVAGELKVSVEFEPKTGSKPVMASNDVSSTTELTEVKLYTDGGSRGNPGPAASGWVILNLEDKIIHESGFYLGQNTNNAAEYTALKKGLEDVLKMGINKLQVYMDSLLIVNQVKGTYKVKSPELLPIYQDVKMLIDKFEHISFTYVPRALNKEADRMVNETLDKELGL